MKKLIAITFLLGTFVNGLMSQCTGTAGSIDNVVCYAEELIDLLSTSQIAELELSYSYDNARDWSNLPVDFTPRLGIELGSLADDQLTAAYALIEEISGTTMFEGYEEFLQIIYADGYINDNGNQNGYGEGLYYLCFNGTPSLTGLFSIKVGGHHLAIENTYNNGFLVGATPHFKAVEPLSFTYNGIDYDPLIEEKNAFKAMLEALSSSELAQAELSNNFSDILLGANNMGADNDWQFPTTKVGQRVGDLSSNQKNLVLAAIETYVSDIDDANGTAIMAKYTSEIDDTYIAFTGSSNFTSTNDYVRIDGPGVWIELSVQNGVIFNGVHYHSVWRDHQRDYGGQGSANGIYDSQIGITTSTNDISLLFSDAYLFPNPAKNTAVLKINSDENMSASISIWDIEGQKQSDVFQGVIQSGPNAIPIDISGLGSGVYLAVIKANGRTAALKLLKQ